LDKEDEIMPVYKVSGIYKVKVFTEIEANSKSEARDYAYEMHLNEFDEESMEDMEIELTTIEKELDHA
jgi:hypothetical protein